MPGSAPSFNLKVVSSNAPLVSVMPVAFLPSGSSVTNITVALASGLPATVRTPLVGTGFTPQPVADNAAVPMQATSQTHDRTFFAIADSSSVTGGLPVGCHVGNRGIDMFDG